MICVLIVVFPITFKICSNQIFHIFFQSTQIQEECDKREKENCRKAEEFRNEYNLACKNLGIDGSSKQTNALKKQVIGLLAELPNTYSKLAEESKSIEPYR